MFLHRSSPNIHQNMSEVGATPPPPCPPDDSGCTTGHPSYSKMLSGNERDEEMVFAFPRIKRQENL